MPIVLVNYYCVGCVFPNQIYKNHITKYVIKSKIIN